MHSVTKLEQVVNPMHTSYYVLNSVLLLTLRRSVNIVVLHYRLRSRVHLQHYILHTVHS